MTSPLLPEVLPAAAGATILVIDDSATMRCSVEKYLGEAGYRVVVAENGFDALAKIGDCRPALIV
ncbi:MAG: response regulator, partial [Janthinobacterium sp.]